MDRIQESILRLEALGHLSDEYNGVTHVREISALDPINASDMWEIDSSGSRASTAAVIFSRRRSQDINTTNRAFSEGMRYGVTLDEHSSAVSSARYRRTLPINSPSAKPDGFYGDDVHWPKTTPEDLRPTQHPRVLTPGPDSFLASSNDDGHVSSKTNVSPSHERCPSAFDPYRLRTNHTCTKYHSKTAPTTPTASTTFSTFASNSYSRDKEIKPHHPVVRRQEVKVSGQGNVQGYFDIIHKPLPPLPTARSGTPITILGTGNVYGSPNNFGTLDGEKDRNERRGEHNIVTHSDSYGKDEIYEMDNQPSLQVQSNRPPIITIFADGIEFEIVSPPTLTPFLAPSGILPATPIPAPVRIPTPASTPIPLISFTPAFAAFSPLSPAFPSIPPGVAPPILAPIPTPVQTRSPDQHPSQPTMILGPDSVIRAAGAPRGAYGAWASDQPRQRKPGSLLDRAHTRVRVYMHEHLVKAGQRPLPSFRVLAVDKSPTWDTRIAREREALTEAQVPKEPYYPSASSTTSPLSPSFPFSSLPPTPAAYTGLGAAVHPWSPETLWRERMNRLLLIKGHELPAGDDNDGERSYRNDLPELETPRREEESDTAQIDTADTKAKLLLLGRKLRPQDLIPTPLKTSTTMSLRANDNNPNNRAPIIPTGSRTRTRPRLHIATPSYRDFQQPDGMAELEAPERSSSDSSARSDATIRAAELDGTSSSIAPPIMRLSGELLALAALPSPFEDLGRPFSPFDECWEMPPLRRRDGGNANTLSLSKKYSVQL